MNDKADIRDVIRDAIGDQLDERSIQALLGALANAGHLAQHAKNTVSLLKPENGRLADVAPTLLDLMSLSQPAEMTGRSLFAKAGARRAAG